MGHGVATVAKGPLRKGGGASAHVDHVLPEPRARWLASIGRITFDPRVYRALRRIISEEQPDIIHNNDYHRESLATILAVKHSRVPAVWTSHVVGDAACPRNTKVLPSGTLCAESPGINCVLHGCVHGSRYFLRYLPRTFVRSCMLRTYRATICPSQAIADHMANAGYPNVHVVPNFVTLRLQETSPPVEKRLLYVGRLEWVKGVFCLADAMKLVLERFPDATLTFAGAGREESRLKERIADLGIAGSITFAGWVDHEKLGAYYRDCDILVVPSLWVEAFGLNILEAASAGRLTVGTRRGGIPEVIVDGETGLLCPANDAGALADAICSVLGDTDLELRLSKNARRHSDAFSAEEHVHQLLDIYRAVIQPRSERSRTDG